MRRYMRACLRLRQWPFPARCTGTAALVGIAFGLRYLLFGWSTDLPFLLFLPAVIAAAVMFDRGSGFVATVLSAILALFFFMGQGPLSSPAPTAILGLVIFCAVGAFIAATTEALHAAYVEAEQARRDIAVASERSLASERRVAMLLREFRHRVSNDMQRIVALLRLQARKTPEAHAALVDAATRVQIIGRIHDRLGHDAEHEMVDTRAFLHELVDDFRKALTDLRAIGFFVDAEPHQLNLSRMGAVGLIVNELVTNALKHAFPEPHREGAITVRFHREERDFILCIEDDGIGVDRVSAAPNEGGMGTHLVRALAAQLGGRIEVEPTKPGTVQRLIFPVTPPGDQAVSAPSAVSKPSGV